MQELGDGNLLFVKGEPLPFVCPKCLMAVPWSQTANTLECECGFQGSREQFSQYDWAFQDGEYRPVRKGPIS